jgi:hypothetical protein
MTQSKLNSLSTRLNVAFRKCVNDKSSDTKDKPTDTNNFYAKTLPFGYFCVQRNEFINFKFSSSSSSKKIDYDYDNEY